MAASVVFESCRAHKTVRGGNQLRPFKADVQLVRIPAEFGEALSPTLMLSPKVPLRMVDGQRQVSSQLASDWRDRICIFALSAGKLQQTPHFRPMHVYYSGRRPNPVVFRDPKLLLIAVAVRGNLPFNAG